MPKKTEEPALMEQYYISSEVTTVEDQRAYKVTVAMFVSEDVHKELMSKVKDGALTATFP